MARGYTVRPGHSFDMGGGKTAGAGEVIELEDDVAAAHAERVDPVPTDNVQTPAPGADAEA